MWVGSCGREDGDSDGDSDRDMDGDGDADTDGAIDSDNDDIVSNAKEKTIKEDGDPHHALRRGGAISRTL